MPLLEACACVMRGECRSAGCSRTVSAHASALRRSPPIPFPRRAAPPRRPRSTKPWQPLTSKLAPCRTCGVSEAGSTSTRTPPRWSAWPASGSRSARPRRTAVRRRRPPASGRRRVARRPRSAPAVVCAPAQAPSRDRSAAPALRQQQPAAASAGELERQRSGRSDRGVEIPVGRPVLRASSTTSGPSLPVGTEPALEQSGPAGQRGPMDPGRRRPDPVRTQAVHVDGRQRLVGGARSTPASSVARSCRARAVTGPARCAAAPSTSCTGPLRSARRWHDPAHRRTTSAVAPAVSCPGARTARPRGCRPANHR